MENDKKTNQQIYPSLKEKSEVFPYKKKSPKRYLTFVISAVLIFALLFALFSSERGKKFAASVSKYLVELSTNKGFDHINGKGEESEQDEESESAETETSTESESEEHISDVVLEDEKTEIKLYTTLDICQVEDQNGIVVNKTDYALDLQRLITSDFSGVGVCGRQTPSVLIIHTNTSEEYIDSHHPELLPNFKGLRTVVSVGERVNYELNARGISSVHCTVIHDGDGSVNPYSESAKTIKTMLEIYPDIKFIIDLHRDELYGEDRTPIKAVSSDNPLLSQISMVVSLWGEGDGREDNMILALKIRERINSNRRNLCAPVVLSANQFNSGLSRYYIKVNIGAVGNTTAEAIEAGEIFAEAFTMAVKGK